MAYRTQYARDDQAFSSPGRGPPIPRAVRPQKSMVDVSTRSSGSRRDRSNAAPSLPSSPRVQGYSREPVLVSTTPGRKSNSFSSASSRGSSTFSREQAYESSTSIEDPPLSKSSRRDWSSSQRRQQPSRLTAFSGNAADDSDVPQSRRSGSSRPSADTTVHNGDGVAKEGYGASLWKSVSSAANTLTINVSKAWATGLFTDDGEVTPDGESRLTKALKSYHLNKARTTSDLPSWLFTEEERRVTRSKFTHSLEEEERDYLESEVREPRRKGLKAIYADIDMGGSSPNHLSTFHTERKTSHNRLDDPGVRSEELATGYHQSKATSRLQAMRDARRPNERRVGDVDRDIGSLAIDEVPSTRRAGLPRGPKQRLN